MNPLVGVAYLTGLLLGPTAFAEGPALCPEQACEGDSCWSVQVPCGWPCGEVANLWSWAERGQLSDGERSCIDSAWHVMSSTRARQPFHELMVTDTAARSDFEGWYDVAVRQLEVTGAPRMACEDAGLMGRRAAVGQLTPGEIACLEGVVRSARLDEERLSASRALIANAHRRRGFDPDSWRGFVHHHLRAVDAHDQKVALDYRRTLAASDPQVAAAVSSMVDAELPRSSGGSDTIGLYVIRTMAELAILDQAQAAAERAGTGVSAARLQSTRASVAERAGEWLDYERGWGTDPSLALGSCLVAGGDCCARAGLEDHPSCFWRGYHPDDSPLDPAILACTGGQDPQQLALVGRLDNDARSCLGAALALADGRPLARTHLSRVLMTDAWAGGDRRRWERTVGFHLAAVDAQDPFVAYEYATYLSKQPDPEVDEVLRFVELAMGAPALRASADGPRMLYELHRMRAFAGYSKWESAVQMGRDAPSFWTRRYEEQTRRVASEYASAWARFAATTERDPAEALLLCSEPGGVCPE